MMESTPSLPDPRFSGEVFYPEYYDQPRPSITLGPGDTTFGTTFEITILREGDSVVDSVVLLRPGAMTHHFDNDQRYIELENSPQLPVYSFPPPSTATLVINVTAPSADLGPPGYYMLFFLVQRANGERVPSAAHFIRIT